jgi:excisionase family DNA binding protein
VKLYTVKEVAEMLKVHDITIIRMIKRGELNATKIANQYRIKEEELNKVINKK